MTTDSITIQVEYYTGQEDDVGYPYFVATNDELGLVTDGRTFEELLINLREALELCLEDGEPNLTPKPRIVITLEMPSDYAQTA